MKIQIAVAGVMPASGSMVSVSARSPAAAQSRIKFLTAKVEKMKAKPQTEIRKARINETVKRIAGLQADLKKALALVRVKIGKVEARIKATEGKIKLMKGKPKTPARLGRIADAERRLEGFHSQLKVLKQTAGPDSSAVPAPAAKPAPAVAAPAPAKPKKEAAPVKPAPAPAPVKKEVAPAQPVKEEPGNRSPKQKNVDRALSFRYDFKDLHDKFSAEELSDMRDELDDRIEALQDRGSLTFSDKQRLDNMRRQWQEVDQVMRVKRRKFMEELDPMYSDDEEWDRRDEYED